MARSASNLNNNSQSNPAAYLLDRYQRLLTYWYNFGIEAQEIADHVIPRKNSITVTRVPGQKRTQRLFDSTAPNCLEKLASSIHGTLTSSYIRWFFLETDDPQLNEVQTVREWLEECSRRMGSEFNKSNFSQEVHEMYLDLCAFGTGCMFEEEEESHPGEPWPGFLFRTQPYGKFVISEGPDGRVDAVFRSIPMMAQAIRMHQDWVIPDDLQDAHADKMFEVIHAVYPANERGKTEWRSVYLLYKGRSILHEGQYKEFPFLVPRWSKVPDETYGRCPSHTALPDIKSLNKIVELELRRISLDVHPPLKVLNGDVLGAVRMVPGGMTTVRGNMDSVQPLLTGAQQTFQIVNLKKAELRQSIQEIYFYDQLQLPQGPQMTAEEVMTRMELMQRLLGPTVGRLESEFLRPLIDRSWAMMLRAAQQRPSEDILPPMPQELRSALANKSVPLKVRFEGPLARTQKSADANAITKLQAYVLPMVQVKQDVLDVIDWDESVRDVAQTLGVPSKIILDQNQVAPIRQQRADAQAQQQQLANIEQAAGAAGKAAPMAKAMQTKSEPGSVDSLLQGGSTNGNQAPAQGGQ